MVKTVTSHLPVVVLRWVKTAEWTKMVQLQHLIADDIID